MRVEEYYTNLGAVHTNVCTVCKDLEDQILRPRRNFVSWGIVVAAGVILLALAVHPQFMDMIVGGF